MKRKITYIIGLALITMFSISCKSNRHKIPPLGETYAQKDKNPFGAFVLYNAAEQFYYHNSIRTIRDKFEHTWRDISDTGSLYIDISKNLFLSRADLEAMLAFVYNGNTLFISSENIDAGLMDTLGCAISGPRQLFHQMQYTSVKLSPEIFTDTTAFQYFYLPFNNHFTKFDTAHARVLGSNKAGPNFIVLFHGKGRFYFHTEPRAFSNYFLLQKDNYKYFQHAFSFTPSIPQHIYWDDYYSKINYPGSEGGNRSSLRVLLQYPSMAWAFWLLLTLFGLYIFFGGKRRQRIIETVPSNTNTTVAFTETIGRLYLQNKDNRNIADKLITYFLEYARNQYYLNTSHINDELITTLSRKSNNTKDGMEKLFGTIVVVQQSMEVSDQQLLLLNQQIQNFYKNKL